MTEDNQVDVAMEVEKQTFPSSCPSQTDSSSSTPEVPPPENHSPAHHTHRLSTVIPNRIFVGGIDYRVKESDLRHVFSQHGAVKEVKIVLDHTGMSKGYGFVTFETEDDVLKILCDANGVFFKDKKLSIGQAFRKQQRLGQSKRAPMAFPESAMFLPVSCLSQYHTTSTGYPYTYYNGVAYFHCPNLNPPAHLWPWMAPPVMAPQSHQPVYQQPAYHHYQCVPNQYQWNVVQSPMPPAPVVYSHPSEYLYQSANGGSVQPPLAVREDTTAELMEQQVYPLYPPRTEAVTPIVLQHNHGKNQLFPLSHAHLKPKFHPYINHKDHHYLLEAAERPDASMLHASQPLM
ncbi:Protein boule-like [Larimichthys crocea]|uniref:Protein boule-like n=1 Tax=Larimichthys crocea TaxID=215358 RepID=A0A6G0HH03_LARCR|nr:Protein boule-like [Larimichthys crocea]